MKKVKPILIIALALFVFVTAFIVIRSSLHQNEDDFNSDKVVGFADDSAVDSAVDSIDVFAVSREEIGVLTAQKVVAGLEAANLSGTTVTDTFTWNDTSQKWTAQNLTTSNGSSFQLFNINLFGLFDDMDDEISENNNENEPIVIGSEPSTTDLEPEPAGVDNDLSITDTEAVQSNPPVIPDKKPDEEPDVEPDKEPDDSQPVDDS